MTPPPPPHQRTSPSPPAPCATSLPPPPCPFLLPPPSRRRHHHHRRRRRRWYRFQAWPATTTPAASGLPTARGSKWGKPAAGGQSPRRGCGGVGGTRCSRPSIAVQGNWGGAGGGRRGGGGGRRIGHMGVGLPRVAAATAPPGASSPDRRPPAGSGRGGWPPSVGVATRGACGGSLSGCPRWCGRLAQRPLTKRLPPPPSYTPPLPLPPRLTVYPPPLRHSPPYLTPSCVHPSLALRVAARPRHGPRLPARYRMSATGSGGG
ncbi:hypothetical protein I4F81_004857 [Pyropia yezoensis]|uniref:Uncharacterized protein n=1 Tax=Pyropia yezoensis TaxID=2788 RepID=A0ACC3BWQ4_PYRYE|nr:hypothetical protein I4F81_004857 [Neopyropia yezoensis]